MKNIKKYLLSTLIVFGALSIFIVPPCYGAGILAIIAIVATIIGIKVELFDND